MIWCTGGPNIATFSWDGEKVTPIINPGGSFKVEAKGEKFEVHAPSCKTKLNILIFGPSPQRGGGMGWLTIAQGDNKSPLYRNSYLALAIGPDAGINKFGSTGFLGGLVEAVLALPRLWASFLGAERAIVEKEEFIDPGLKNVHQYLIGCTAGVMPRDLFYLDMDHPQISDRWLYAQLDTYFLFRGKRDLKFPTTPEELKQYMVLIILALGVYISTFKYQPDRVLTQGRQLMEYEHFSKLVLFFKAGDCEDLAWAFACLLNRLQRRAIQNKQNGLSDAENLFLDQCTKVMDHYVVTNCLVQATAPEASAGVKTGILHLALQGFKDYPVERELLLKMHTWHMTCMVYPKSLFLRMNNIELEKKWYSHNFKPELEKGLVQLYAEGTAPIYPDPTFKFPPQEQIEIQDFVSEDQPGHECCLLPSANNLDTDTCIYGAWLEVMTDFFIDKEMGPQSTIFLVRYGPDNLAGCMEFHFPSDHDKFKLHPIPLKLPSNYRDVLDAEPPLPPIDLNIQDYRTKRPSQSENLPFFFYFTNNQGDPTWPSIPQVHYRLLPQQEGGEGD
jgi:hypothetical protein